MSSPEQPSIEYALTAMEDDGVSDAVHHPYTAFNQGFAAFDHGLSRESNPYTEDRLRSWWDMGWEEAREQESLDA